MARKSARYTVKPMVIAHHAIFTAYGFWLPNDPRGSWSDYIRNWELLHFGKATQVTTRRSLAKHPHQFQRRREAKQALKYPAVKFTGRQALSVSKGFGRAINESDYAVHACSILPEHVHMVIARHVHSGERMIGHLKARATQQLITDGLHPLADYRKPDGTYPSPWARRGWPVFLDNHARVRAAIAYVEKNPIREGKPPQKWSFVVPYAV